MVNFAKNMKSAIENSKEKFYVSDNSAMNYNGRCMMYENQQLGQRRCKQID